MKNIHVLPTDKPSNYVTNYMEKEMQWHNIYITSDEEIKEGDYMYDIDGDVGKAIGSDMKEFEGNKKIILTTDQDLIKDGVQAIDDEFLEWFVNNPSCKYGGYKDIDWDKIITSKEEPKQLTDLEIAIKLEEIQREESKQETLEEAAERYCEKVWGGYKDDVFKHDDIITDKTLSELSKKDFIEGAKWQAERMYSEKDILKSFDNLGFKQISSEELNSLPYQPFITDENGNIWVIDKEKWFEQFKKKI